MHCKRNDNYNNDFVRDVCSFLWKVCLFFLILKIYNKGLQYFINFLWENVNNFYHIYDINYIFFSLRCTIVPYHAGHIDSIWSRRSKVLLCSLFLYFTESFEEMKTNSFLTHYSPVLLIYTPLKHQKIFRFSIVFRGYR